MSSMFGGTDAFNQPINNWNTGKVTDMSTMFFFAFGFNQPIEDWNTNSVTSMRGMFEGAHEFNQNLSKWETSSVSDFRSTFKQARNFNQNLGAWNLSGTTNASSMLDFSGISIQNYDSTLIAWRDQGYMNVMLSALELQYCNAKNARQELEDNLGWTINDGGINCNIRPCQTIEENRLLSPNVDWHQIQTNWSLNHIPEECDEVVIPSFTRTQITTKDAACYSITVQNRGRLEVMMGRQLEVWADSISN